MIVTDGRVAQFVSDQLGIGLCPPYTCMGVERGGIIVGGVIFHCFEGANVHFTAAGKGWTRAFFEAVGRYVFEQLGCLRMTATTEHDDVARMACKLGGEIEGYLRNQFGKGRDGIVIGILKEDWRFS